MVYSDKIDKLLVESGSILPIPYSVWLEGSDDVFVSDQLCVELHADSNVLNAYTFVKLVQDRFGSVLHTAVEQIMAGADLYKCQVSHNNEIHLILNRKIGIYLFVLRDKTEVNRLTQIQRDLEAKNCALEAILDNLPIYVWQKDRNSRITYCNAAYAAALGCPKATVVKDNVQLVPMKTRNNYINHNLYSSKSHQFTEEGDINGIQRVLSIYETPFMKNHKSTGVAIDVTEQSDIAKKYNAQKERIGKLFDDIYIPIAIFDANEKLVLANFAVKQLFMVEGMALNNDCTIVDILNYMLSNNSVITSADIEKYKQKIHSLFQQQISPRCVSIYLKNGNILAVTIASTNDGGVIFIFNDITDKITLERRVSSIWTVQAEIFEHLSAGIIIFGLDKKIKQLNNVAKSLWSNSSAEMKIDEFFVASSQLLEPESKTKLMEICLPAMIGYRNSFSEILHFISGTAVLMRYEPLHDGQNLLEFSDVTDQINLKKCDLEKTEINTKNNELKLQLIQNISKAVRAPIQAITEFSEVLNREYFGELNEKQKEYCNGIISSADNLSAISDSIMSLYEIEAGIVKIKQAKTNLLNFIQNVILSFNDKCERHNISLTTDFADDDIFILIDEAWMKKALSCLISKAIRDVPANGQKVVISALVDFSSQNIEISIKDNGNVWDNENLERITKMLTSKNKSLNYLFEYELALANAILELHNGHLSIQSDEHVGNISTLSFPVSIS